MRRDEVEAFCGVVLFGEVRLEMSLEVATAHPFFVWQIEIVEGGCSPK